MKTIISMAVVGAFMLVQTGSAQITAQKFSPSSARSLEAQQPWFKTAGHLVEQFTLRTVIRLLGVGEFDCIAKRSGCFAGSPPERATD